MPARWDGNSGRTQPFVRRRENKRTSIKVPGEPFGELCRARPEYPYSQEPQVNRPRLFTPDQVYNYKSAWARYQRGLSLRPSKVSNTKNKSIYYYKSCNAPTGYWEVIISKGGATFIDAGKSLTILCPPIGGYQLNQVTSDGELFRWEQLAGTRTVLIEPTNALNPTLYIQNSCFTTGCDDGTSLPIILRVSIEESPELFDNLIIYNTPTSTNFFNSFASIGIQDKDCQRVQPVLAPSYLQKAYRWQGEPIGVTWTDPTCDLQYLVRYIWQSNTTGQYISVEDFLKGEDRYFLANANTHYHIVAEYNILGKVYYTPSKTIYYAYPQDKDIIFGDDTYRGLALTKLANAVNKVINQVTAYEVLDTYDSPLAYQFIAKSYSKIELTVETTNLTDSIRGNPSHTKLANTYNKVNLGGIVIG